MINKIKCLRNIHYWLLTAWKIRKLNFVIIGAEKCGTTALFDCLKKHPYCIAPNRKETRMFSLRYEKHFNVFHSISYFNPKEIFLEVENISYLKLRLKIFIWKKLQNVFIVIIRT